SVETVDGNPQTEIPQPTDTVSDAAPGLSRDAADVDHIRAAVAQTLCFGDKLIDFPLWRVVDLGDDLDVILGKIGRRSPALAEMLGKVKQIFGAAFERNAEFLFERLQIAAAPAGDDRPIELAPKFELAGDPVGVHERRDGD